MDKKIKSETISRRQALKLTAGGTLGILSGCAINPVTGQQQLMLVSEQQEIQMDRQSSPHQFSADYGAVQDSRVSNYITEVGISLSSSSHRPNMPYSFRCVMPTTLTLTPFPEAV